MGRDTKFRGFAGVSGADYIDAYNAAMTRVLASFRNTHGDAALPLIGTDANGMPIVIGDIPVVPPKN